MLANTTLSNIKAGDLIQVGQDAVTQVLQVKRGQAKCRRPRRPGSGCKWVPLRELADLPLLFRRGE